MEDLTGQKFGRLTIIDNTPISQNWSRKYKCRCDCGNEKYVSLYNLRTGHTNSCGKCGYCLAKRMETSHIFDNTGLKFGKLTAIRPVGQDSHKRAIWEFKCDCGNTYVGPIHNVKNGNTKSCGCAKFKEAPNALDLVGKTFGRLTVLEKDRTEKGILYWRCLCSCGNETILPTGRLTSGHTKSCGCLVKELQSKESFNSKWNHDLRKLYDKECQKCGSKESIAVHHIFPKNLFPNMRRNPLNGITLCTDCHRKFHHLYGHKCTIEDLGEFLELDPWNVSVVKLMILIQQKGFTIDDCKYIKKLLDDRIKMLENVR